MDRKTFVKNAGRGLIAAGIVAGGGYLLLKPDSGTTCDFDFICKNCKELKSCNLSEAKKFKEQSEQKPAK